MWGERKADLGKGPFYSEPSGLTCHIAANHQPICLSESVGGTKSITPESKPYNYMGSVQC